MTPQKKTSHHIFKMAIFSKFFGDVIILIIRANADKRIKKNSDIFSIKNLEYTFVCFLSIQSLYTLDLFKPIWTGPKSDSIGYSYLRLGTCSPIPAIVLNRVYSTKLLTRPPLSVLKPPINMKKNSTGFRPNLSAG